MNKNNTKLINPMKIRNDEYKGFAVDLKHGKPVEKEEEKKEKEKY